jgi:hypothetical protein
MVNSIEQLLLLGKGDRGRLEYMLGLLQKGRILPSSDQKYLENAISLYLGGTSTESLQYSGHNGEELYDEIQTLNQKIIKLEQKGIEKYFGKKAVLFFATFFIGWNALQTYIVSALNPFITNDMIGYLFPLNALANYFNAASLVWFVFILMILAWPFIGAIHLANFIRSRKIPHGS